MLAKNVNDYADILNERGVLRFFASRLAPTEESHPQNNITLDTKYARYTPTACSEANRMKIKPTPAPPFMERSSLASALLLA